MSTALNAMHRFVSYTSCPGLTILVKWVDWHEMLAQHGSEIIRDDIAGWTRDISASPIFGILENLFTMVLDFGMTDSRGRSMGI
jgi:hypothetical protein